MIFLDLETTGLDPSRHRILECAVLVTDDALNPITARVWLSAMVLRSDECDPAVYAMHTASGLTAAVGVGPADLPLDDVLAFLLPPGTRIAGFSPHFDVAFLKAKCPRAWSCLHHRVYDCSTLRDLCADYGQPLMGDGEAAHRALADCFAALQVMRRFRSIWSSTKHTTEEGQGA